MWSLIPLPFLRSVLTPAIQQIPTEQPRLPDSQTPAPLSSCFRRSRPTQFCGATRLGRLLLQDPASAARVGCLWKPAYQVKVGSRSRCSHGGNVEAAEAVLSPLHPGLLTASLVRSNSGHGRKRFQVPLHPRFFTLHQGVSLVDTWLLYIPTNCLATPPFFVLFLSLVRVEKSKCSEQIGLQCDRVRTRVVSVKAPFKIQ